MDWRVMGAVSGVTVLAVAVTLGAVAVVRSSPEPQKRPSTYAPPLRFEPRPKVGVLNGAEVTTIKSSNYGPAKPKAAAAPARPKPGPKLSSVSSKPEPMLTPGKPAALPQGPLATPKPSAPDSHVAPAKPNIKPPKATDHRFDGVLTLAEIGRIKSTMRLTREQEPQWVPVERALRDIGRQQTANVNAGKKPEINSGSVQRLYSAAGPLLGTLRPDQKEQIRKIARQMGYNSVASMI